MNKKKRALAFGLAAAQLSALSVIAAPLTAFAADENDDIPDDSPDTSIKESRAEEQIQWTVQANGKILDIDADYKGKKFIVHLTRGKDYDGSNDESIQLIINCYTGGKQVSGISANGEGVRVEYVANTRPQQSGDCSVYLTEFDQSKETIDVTINVEFKDVDCDGPYVYLLPDETVTDDEDKNRIFLNYDRDTKIIDLNYTDKNGNQQTVSAGEKIHILTCGLRDEKGIYEVTADGVKGTGGYSIGWFRYEFELTEEAVADGKAELDIIFKTKLMEGYPAFERVKLTGEKPTEVDEETGYLNYEPSEQDKETLARLAKEAVLAHFDLPADDKDNVTFENNIMYLFSSFPEDEDILDENGEPIRDVASVFLTPTDACKNACDNIEYAYQYKFPEIVQVWFYHVEYKEAEKKAVTEFEIGYADGKDAIEINYNDEDPTDETILKGVELISVTVDGEKIEGDDLAEIADKFELKVVTDEDDGTKKVTLDLASGANKTYGLETDDSSDFDVTIIKTIDPDDLDTVLDAAIESITTGYTPESPIDVDDAADEIKKQVEEDIAGLFAEDGDLEDLKNVLELTVGDPEPGDDGKYTVAVTPSIKDGVEGFKLTSDDDIEIEIELKKLELTGTIDFKNSGDTTATVATNKVNTSDDDIKAAVKELLKAPTFTKVSDSSAVELTDKDYTVTYGNPDTTNKTVTVTVSPSEDSLVNFTPVTKDVSFAYTPTPIDVPTSEAADPAKPVEIPANAKDVEALLLDAVKLAENTDAEDYDISFDKNTVETIFTGSDTETTVTATITIHDEDNYKWTGDNTGSQTLTLNVHKGAEVPVVTPTFGGTLTEPNAKLYITDFTEDAVLAALDESGSTALEVSFNNESGEAETVEAGDYKLTVTDISGGVATVKAELTAAGAKKLVIKDGATLTQAINVIKEYDAPESTLTITDEFESNVTSGAIKTAVTAAIESMLADMGITSGNYDIAEFTPEAGTGSKDVDVTITLKPASNAEFKGADNTHTDSCTIKVSYTVAAVKYNVTEGSTGEHGSVTLTSPMEAGKPVTITTTPDTGYVVDAVTVTGDDGTKIDVTVTGNTGTFTMPEQNVTVTVTFKAGGNTGNTGNSGSSGSHSGSGSSGSHRPGSSGSSGSSSDNSNTSSEIASMINSAVSGSTVKFKAKTLSSDNIKAAVSKGVNLHAEYDDTFIWIIDPTKLPNINTLLDLSVITTPTDTNETAKIEKSKGVVDKNDRSFRTVETKLGTGAKLSVKTFTVSDENEKIIANLYKKKADGTLEFVTSAPVGTDGRAVFPITEAATYTIVTSGESKKPGDINNDCTVDLSDVMAMLNIYVNSGNLTRADNFKMDFDGNGKCELSDIVLTLRNASEQIN